MKFKNYDDALSYKNQHAFNVFVKNTLTRLECRSVEDLANLKAQNIINDNNIDNIKRLNERINHMDNKLKEFEDLIIYMTLEVNKSNEEACL